MAKKTRTELTNLALNTNLPDNTSEQITPTTERAQLTDERDSVINYKDDLGGTSNAGKFLTVASDGESLTMVDGATGDVTGTGAQYQVAVWDGTSSLTGNAAFQFLTGAQNSIKLVRGSGSGNILFYAADGTTLHGYIENQVSGNGLTIGQQDGSTSAVMDLDDSTITFKIDNSAALTIDSALNVGIGTASPSVKLETHGSIRAVNSGTTTKHASINPDGLYIAGAQDGYLVSPQAWEFYAGNTKRMTIDSSGNIGAPSGSNIHSVSDQRLKKNINSISEGLNKINNLNPINFNWIDGFCEAEKDKTLSGFVAQEVQNVIPEAVNLFTDDSIKVNGETIEEPLTVNEKLIIPYLVKAIQQLTARIESLENG